MTFTRNELDRISRVDTTLGGVTKTLATSIGYVPFGGVADLAYGNGLSLARDYDNQYRVSPIEVAGVLGLTCQYYADGNVKTIEDALGPGGAIPEDSAVYSYETVSNRLLNFEGASSTDVGSDANGNITNEGQRTLVYDPLNQLVRVLEGASVIADYVYNALGERIIKVAEGATTVYHYDVKGRLIAETNQAGATLAEYVYLDSDLLSMIKPGGTGGSVYYFHNDHLGTPWAMTDASGNVAWKARYSPFGQARITVHTVENPFRFQCQYYDAETGFHYNYYRHYDPKTGRYVTPDPIGLEGGIDPYVYVENNPVNLADPDGLEERVSSATLRRVWERFYNQQWPKDPATGWNQDVAHDIPLADGGTNDVTNIGPKLRSEHMQKHCESGDFKRWGAKSRGALKVIIGALGLISDILMSIDAKNRANEINIDPWTIMIMDMGIPVVIIDGAGHIVYTNIPGT